MTTQCQKTLKLKDQIKQGVPTDERTFEFQHTDWEILSDVSAHAIRPKPLCNCIDDKLRLTAHKQRHATYSNDYSHLREDVLVLCNTEPYESSLASRIEDIDNRRPCALAGSKNLQLHLGIMMRWGLKKKTTTWKEDNYASSAYQIVNRHSCWCTSRWTLHVDDWDTSSDKDLQILKHD